MKQRRLLILFDTPFELPNNSEDYLKYFTNQDWRDEKDIYTTLKCSGKYTIQLQGIYDSIQPVLDKIDSFKPEIVFSIAESFSGQRALSPQIVSLLELMGIKYTGASSNALLLCRNKALSKKILHYHGIRVPKFVLLSESLSSDLRNFNYPAIVKPNEMEASEGISLSSIVNNYQDCRERIRMLQQKYEETDIIIEQFIPGKDIYMGVLGRKSLLTLPPRELLFKNAENPNMRIASYKAKWDADYRKRWGIKSTSIKLPDSKKAKQFDRIARKIFRVLRLSGYARIDLRQNQQGELYFLEANPNPAINKDDEFALSAKDAGLNYEDLLEMILNCA